MSTNTATMRDEVLRSVWARTSRRLLYGRAFRRELENPNWWQRLLRRRYEPGTYFEFARLTRDQALAALGDFLRDPKEFAIETAEGCRLDVILEAGDRKAFLDTWFSDGGIEDTIVLVADLGQLISLVYDTTSDRDIASWLREHGTRVSSG